MIESVSVFYPLTLIISILKGHLCSCVVCLCFSQNDDERSDFDLPPSWVAPIEVSLKGDRVVFFFTHFSNIVFFVPNNEKRLKTVFLF